MRNTRKIALALVIVMILAMTFAIIPASAATPETLYLTPNANWKADNARFAAYFFGNGEKWVGMTDADKDGVYEVTVPAGYPNVIFCRMDPGKTTNDWNSKWNQTADLTVPTDGPNHYTVKEGTWDKGGGTWSTFGSTCAHANLGDAATCTTAQTCLDCGDPVVSALGHSFNSAHLCTRCNQQASFTVAGTGAHLGTEWDTGNTANDMTYADGVYTKVYTNVAAGSYKFKVARDHDWGTAYPSADKSFTVSTAGSTVTITLKGTTVDIKVEAPHVHSWSDATCTEAQKCECGETQGEALGHSFAEGVCSACGAEDPNYVPPHEHNFVEGKCECGEEDPNYIPPHEHNFVEGKCECGESDPNYVPPHEHNFVEGKCECGEVDPDYVAPEVPAANDKLINFSTWPEFAKETYADGDVYKLNDIFTFIMGKNSRVDASSKTWDDFSGDLRFSLGGKTNSGVPTKNAIQITVDGAHTLKIWYVAGGDARYFELRDADGSAIATTTAETVKNSQYYSELEIPAAGVYYLTIPADNNYIFQLELVAKAVEEPIDPPHVNTLVVGDTNKIVVSGATLNDFGLPIEWVGFVADEKAHYEFIGDNGALAYIFDANFGLISATGAADLEAGAYWICLGNGFVGEFNVAVTKSEIVIPEPPADDKWTFWISSTDYYTVDGYNIKYNGAGNSYACVGTADVVSLAVGNNTFVITITNNGSADARVRVDIQATNTIGNHAVCNTNAVGGDVWTDFEWGGSIVTVPAGESVTLTITYDENTERGAVANLVIFVDAMRGDGEMYSADITLSDMAFSYVSDEPADYTNTLVVGDNNVTIGHKAIDNGYGYLMETVVFTADAKAHYKFAGEGLTVLVYDLSMNNLCAFTGEADLDAGMYIICFAANTTGTTGEYSISVTKSEISDGPVVEPELPALNLGDNTVVIDGSQTNLTGNAVAWYSFTPAEAGTYKFACPDLTVYILVDKNMSNLGSYIGADGIAELEAGVMYYILVGKEGVKGEFTLTVESGEIEVPHKNSVALGDNHYIVSDALLATGYEWLNIEIAEPGTYVIKGGAPMTVFFFTVPGTLDENSPNKWNISSTTYEYVEEFYVTLTEAGTYWMGFRYDNIGDLREFDFNVSLHAEHTFVEGKCVCGAEDPTYQPPHEHNFVEGKCECGEEDPNYQPPEQGGDDTPSEPEAELNFFQKIIKAITDFFANIGNWFKNLFAKK